MVVSSNEVNLSWISVPLVVVDELNLIDEYIKGDRVVMVGSPTLTVFKDAEVALNERVNPNLSIMGGIIVIVIVLRFTV